MPQAPAAQDRRDRGLGRVGIERRARGGGGGGGGEGRVQHARGVGAGPRGEPPPGLDREAVEPGLQLDAAAARGERVEGVRGRERRAARAGAEVPEAAVRERRAERVDALEQVLGVDLAVRQAAALLRHGVGARAGLDRERGGLRGGGAAALREHRAHFGLSFLSFFV